MHQNQQPGQSPCASEFDDLIGSIASLLEALGVTLCNATISNM